MTILFERETRRRLPRKSDCGGALKDELELAYRRGRTKKVFGEALQNRIDISEPWKHELS